MTAYTYEGGCHCGNLSFVFEATRSLDELGLRACMCSFCRKHGARNTSDPKGAMRIAVRERDKLVRYRFGLKTADFLLCANCGVYIGAMLSENGKSWMTVNADAFREPPALGHMAVPHHFDHEDTAGRIARRKERWTPVTEFKA
jgi:hypothetical protein